MTLALFALFVFEFAARKHEPPPPPIVCAFRSSPCPQEVANCWNCWTALTLQMEQPRPCWPCKLIWSRCSVHWSTSSTALLPWASFGLFSTSTSLLTSSVTPLFPLSLCVTTLQLSGSFLRFLPGINPPLRTFSCTLLRLWMTATTSLWVD